MMKELSGTKKKGSQEKGAVRRPVEAPECACDEAGPTESGSREGDDRFHALVEAAGDWIWEIGTDWLFSYASPKVKDLLGYEPEEVVGKDPFDFMPGEERKRVGALFTDIMKSRRPFSGIENVNLHKGGWEVVLETNGVPVFDKEGNFLGYRGFDRDVTERKRAEEALRMSRLRLAETMELARIVHWEVDPETEEFIANDPLYAFLGTTVDREGGYRLEPAEYVKRFVHPDDRADFGRVIAVAATQEDAEFLSSSEHRIVRRDGEVRYVMMRIRVIRGSSARTTRVYGSTQDITDHVRAEARLKESEERYRTAIEHSNDGVAIEKEGRAVYVNRRFLDMFGYVSLDEYLRGRRREEVHPDDRRRVMGYARKRQRGQPAPSRYEYRAIRTDGTVIYIEASVAVTVYDGGLASLAYLRDVTDRKRMEERLKAMSTTDELTGLSNRRGFLALAQQQLKLAKRTGKSLELFFMDIDGMKEINDTRGHQEGDEALVDVSTILRRTFRQSDIIGRMGGDEFAVLAVDATSRDGETLTRRLNVLLREFNSAHARKSQLSLSVGAALFDPARPESLDDLIARADDLMYMEKSGKRHRR